jgi:hypothetical protein
VVVVVVQLHREMTLVTSITAAVTQAGSCGTADDISNQYNGSCHSSRQLWHSSRPWQQSCRHGGSPAQCNRVMLQRILQRRLRDISRGGNCSSHMNGIDHLRLEGSKRCHAVLSGIAQHVAITAGRPVLPGAAWGGLAPGGVSRWP